MLRVKSVKSPIDPEEEGFRILATRFRGRGLPAELRAASPLDAKSRTIKNHGQKFTLRLIKALAEKQDVTLMCLARARAGARTGEGLARARAGARTGEGHCKEEAKNCHRFLLRREVLRS